MNICFLVLTSPQSLQTGGLCIQVITQVLLYSPSDSPRSKIKEILFKEMKEKIIPYRRTGGLPVQVTLPMLQQEQCSKLSSYTL